MAVPLGQPHISQERHSETEAITSYPNGKKSLCARSRDKADLSYINILFQNISVNLKQIPCCSFFLYIGSAHWIDWVSINEITSAGNQTGNCFRSTTIYSLLLSPIHHNHTCEGVIQMMKLNVVQRKALSKIYHRCSMQRSQLLPKDLVLFHGITCCCRPCQNLCPTA